MENIIDESRIFVFAQYKKNVTGCSHHPEIILYGISRASHVVFSKPCGLPEKKLSAYLHRRMPVLSGGYHGSRSGEFVVVDREQRSLSETVANVQAARASVGV
jgi:hypothetical protein